MTAYPLDVVARNFRDPGYHFEHSGDDIFQEICLFAEDFICQLVHQRQNALQRIQKAQWRLVVCALFL